MYRITAVFVSLLMLFSPMSSALAQSSRYRTATKADKQDLGPAPSFRGSERQTQQYPRDLQPGSESLSVPFGMSSGNNGGLGDALGSAALSAMGYQVHVLGEVMMPGTYKVAASDRVSEVIRRAGGLAVNGSERQVELRRKGGGVRKLDLLAFSLFGSLNDNPYVTDNDVIFVPLRKSVIQIVGAVKRPDYYELKNEKTLQAIIDLAGGFNAATAKKGVIRVIRFEEGEKTVKEIPIQEEALKRFQIENGDVVVVPNIVTKGTKFDYNVASIPGDQVFYPSYEDRVFVLGGVAFPGAYPFSPFYTVSQYITLAGGLDDRGKDKYKVTSIDGESRKVKPDSRVNPGDTIDVKKSWMSPASWMSFVLGVASFGLSASATIIAITK